MSESKPYIPEVPSALMVSVVPEGFAFTIKKIENPVAYKSVAEALTAMTDVVEVDVENEFDLHRVRLDIARQSRRGMGNVIYSNDAHQLFEEPLTNFNAIEYDIRANGTFLIYRSPGNKSIDGAVLQYGDEEFYIHPDYQNLVRKINFK